MFTCIGTCLRVSACTPTCPLEHAGGRAHRLGASSAIGGNVHPIRARECGGSGGYIVGVVVGVAVSVQWGDALWGWLQVDRGVVGGRTVRVRVRLG